MIQKYIPLGLLDVKQLLYFFWGGRGGETSEASALTLQASSNKYWLQK